LQPASKVGEYSLATGEAAVRRLTALHRVYSPSGRRVLLQAGLKPGMIVADLGCGIGATTCMLAEMVAPSGLVTGIDVSPTQLEQCRNLCKAKKIANATFMEASATATGLPRKSFDPVYCRFLLLHLVDPAACLHEMREILKTGGVLVVEDGDLTSAGSTPACSLHAFADLFGRLGPTRGLNYAVSRNLYHLVQAAGFPQPEIEIHQPAVARGEDRFLLKWSVEEAAPAFIAAGLITDEEIRTTLVDMDRDTRNPDILILMPQMSLVWARKPN
jgi:ubiquinone/menaquinone biosynthesis C-methylase UbiE